MTSVASSETMLTIVPVQLPSTTHSHASRSKAARTLVRDSSAGHLFPTRTPKHRVRQDARQVQDAGQSSRQRELLLVVHSIGKYTPDSLITYLAKPL